MRASASARTIAGNGNDSTGKRPLLRPASIGVPLALLIVYALGWLAAVQQQGIESITRQTDFIATHTGALIIEQGNGPLLYDLDAQRAAQRVLVAPYIGPAGGPAPHASGKWLSYIHPPWEAVLFAPLAQLPVPVLFAGWSLLMLTALGFALRVMHGALPMPGHALPVVVIALCTYQPVARSFMLGQGSPLVLLGLCGAYAALKRNAPVWAAACLLPVTIKPQALMPVLLFLLLHHHWKTLMGFGALLGTACVACMPLLGVDWPLRYLSMLSTIADSPQAGVHPEIMPNWRGLATGLFGGWAPGLVVPAFLLLGLLTLGLVAWCAVRVPATASTKPSVRSGSEGLAADCNLDPNHNAYRPGHDLLWALVGVSAVLTSPHLNPHDLTLLLLPAWIIAAYATSGLWQARTSAFWLLVLWAGYAIIPLTFYASMDLGWPARTVITVFPIVAVMGMAAVQLARQIAHTRRGRSPAPVPMGAPP
jgi:hypothetical protein